MNEKTKIICTIGPASSSRTELEKMVLNGMDVARLNFSHGRREDHEKTLKNIKKIEKTTGKKIEVLEDLEGFRVRVGSLLAEGKKEQVRVSQSITLFKGEKSAKIGEIPFSYDGDIKKMAPGTRIHIDGGKIVLRVEKAEEKKLLCRVEEEGTIKIRKGINIPEFDLGFYGLTEKDKKDLEFAYDNKIDMVAQSFVRKKEDVQEVKVLLKEHSPDTQVIAKIENRQALLNLDSIISVSDGIMVARGDLGIEIPLWEVPYVQKKIINKCHEAGKPVITATEMLESMTRRKLPTRAEVSDVANAIIDGSDYVMLSEETAVGSHPARTVDMMQKIIDYTTGKQEKGKLSRKEKRKET